jgi:uncharacterized protein (TIGR03086 family)
MVAGRAHVVMVRRCGSLEDGRVEDLRGLHRRAIAGMGEIVGRVGAAELGNGTPCAGWDLRALLAHVVGQHHGFARAVVDGDAGVEAYAPRDSDWAESAEALLTAFAGADLERPVRLVEIRGGQLFPVGAAVAFQLLDTVVHTWDVAAARSEDWRPDDELAGVTRKLAELVPQGESRLAEGAAFAPVVETSGGDPWAEALALTGRRVSA